MKETKVDEHNQHSAHRDLIQYHVYAYGQQHEIVIQFGRFLLYNTTGPVYKRKSLNSVAFHLSFSDRGFLANSLGMKLESFAARLVQANCERLLYCSKLNHHLAQDVHLPHDDSTCVGVRKSHNFFPRHHFHDTLYDTLKILEGDILRHAVVDGSPQSIGICFPIDLCTDLLIIQLLDRFRQSRFFIF